MGIESSPRFRVVDPRRLPKSEDEISRFKHRFATETGFFTEKELREVGAFIAQECLGALAETSEEDRVLFIVELLSPSSLARHINRDTPFMVLNFNDSDDPEVMTPAELEQVLMPLRAVILDEVQSHLPDNQLKALIGRLGGSLRVWEAVDGQVIKYVLEGDYPPESPQAMQDRMEAFAHLYSLQPRSPFILYSLVQLALPNRDFDTAVEVQKKMDFMKLEDFRDSGASRQEVLAKILDVTQGLLFLYEHQLGLMDICLDNLAVLNTPDHTGVLFDFDGLRFLTAAMGSYYNRTGHYPPEYYDAHQCVITEATMIYQLGKSIFNVLLNIQDKSVWGYAKIDALTNDMLSENPLERPSLQASIDAMRAILSNT